MSFWLSTNSTLRSHYLTDAILGVVVFGIATSVLLPSNAYSQEKSKFTIVYAADWPPISYGIGGAVDGILPRLMGKIFTGNNVVEVVHHGLPWERAQHLFHQGKVDGMVATPTTKRLSHSARSDEIAIQIPFQPIVRQDSELADVSLFDENLSALKHYRFCDVLGNGWAKEFYGKRDIEYSVAPTIDHCIQQLNLNRVDIVIHALPVLEVIRAKLDLEIELEILDLIVDGGHRFPLMVSNKFEDQKRVLDSFDTKVTDWRRTNRLNEIMEELVNMEKQKVGS
ncbi:hypothetical protein [Roseibium sp.]|uniref:hypothetical protein n=1 Tax=Roseibium sp. TaxID=1936156 RepID=UPI003B525710